MSTSDETAPGIAAVMAGLRRQRAGHDPNGDRVRTGRLAGASPISVDEPAAAEADDTTSGEQTHH